MRISLKENLVMAFLQLWMLKMLLGLRVWRRHVENTLKATASKKCGSIISGLLVAATMITPSSDSTPSMLASSWFTTRFETSLPSEAEPPLLMEAMRFELIKEDDRRCRLLCLLENLTDCSFGFSDPLRNQFRSFDADEICLGLVSDGFSKERLSSSRCPEEHNSSRWFDAKVLKEFRFGKRPFH